VVVLRQTGEPAPASGIDSTGAGRAAPPPPPAGDSRVSRPTVVRPLVDEAQQNSTQELMDRGGVNLEAMLTVARTLAAERLVSKQVVRSLVMMGGVLTRIWCLPRTMVV
jgi:hypothetical protein